MKALWRFFYFVSVACVMTAGLFPRYFASAQEVDAKANSSTQGQDLDGPFGEIVGRVFRADTGEPVAGTEVWTLTANYERGGERRLYLYGRTFTDAQGNFRMPRIRAGRYFVGTGGAVQHSKKEGLQVKKPDDDVWYPETYVPANAQSADAKGFLVKFGGKTLELQIAVKAERSFRITGKVDAGKSPKSNCSITLLAELNRSQTLFSEFRASEVLPDGSFTISGLPHGDYTIQAVAICKLTGAQTHVDGFARAQVTDKDVRADVRLGQAGEVRGRVRFEDSRRTSFKGVEVFIGKLSGYGGALGSPLDSRGRFEILNLEPGEHTLGVEDSNGSEGKAAYVKHAICSGTDYAKEPLKLDIGTKTDDCEITIGNVRGSISGKVLKPENAASLFRVIVIPTSRELRRMPGTIENGVIASPGGEFHLDNVIPGEYFVFGWAGSPEESPYYALDYLERNRLDMQTVTVQEGATAVVTLNPPRK